MLKLIKIQKNKHITIYNEMLKEKDEKKKLALYDAYLAQKDLD